MAVIRRRRRVVRRRRRAVRRHMGRGLWDKIKSAHNWIKSNKIISTVGNALSGVPVIGNIAGTIGRTAATFGYGRRRRRTRGAVVMPNGAVYGVRRTVKRRLVRRRVLGGRRRRVRRGRYRRVKRRRGGSVRSILSAAHGFVRKNQLISKALNHFGHSKLASVASTFGYGRRRRTTRRVLHRGMGGAHNQIAAIKF